MAKAEQRHVQNVTRDAEARRAIDELQWWFKRTARDIRGIESSGSPPPVLKALSGYGFNSLRRVVQIDAAGLMRMTGGLMHERQARALAAEFERVKRGDGGVDAVRAEIAQSMIRGGVADEDSRDEPVFD